LKSCGIMSAITTEKTNMKTLITFLFSSLFLLLSHTQTQACDLDPTAVIDILPDEVVFLVGDSIYMEAYHSSPNCGYISGYRWRVDGVTQSTSGYFIPSLTLQSGEDSRSFDIQLRVQNSAGNYGYKTVTITIVREHSSYYYLTDHLGSVRVTVDDQGNSVGWDDYYPFGLQMPGRTQNSSNPNDDAKFTGYLLEQDGDLGLYHAEARMYDPVIGRFMQVDPLTDDPKQVHLTPYNYAWNNPILLNDPDGRCPSCVAGAIIGGLLDVGFQMAVEGQSFSEVDWVSVGISAGAGAMGAGIVSGVNKLRRGDKINKAVQVLGEIVTDGSVSAGEQLIREGDVDAFSTTTAILFGQSLRSPIRDNVISAGQSGVRSRQINARTAERKARNATQNSTREGKMRSRQNHAESARRSAKNSELINQTNGVASGTTAAGVARKTVEEIRKKKEERR